MVGLSGFSTPVLALVFAAVVGVFVIVMMGICMCMEDEEYKQVVKSYLEMMFLTWFVV